MDNTIDSLIKQESNRIFAYIDMGKPFDYISYVNKEFFKNKYDIKDYQNFALDCYNYYIKEVVICEAKQLALLRTFERMYKRYDNVK